LSFRCTTRCMRMRADKQDDGRPHEHDAALINAAAFLRSATVGLTGVVLAIYLAEIGLSAAAIGIVIGAGLAGTAIATLVVSLRGDVLGRRRTLIALAFLSAIGYVTLAASSRVAILVPLAFCAMLNGMGRDRGAASALDQAILPETTGPERRTWGIAWYNLVLDGGHAIGALAGATPTLLMHAVHLSSVTAHRATFLMCAGATVLSIVPYILLTDRIEVAGPSTLPTARLDRRSRRAVTRLTLLFGVDSLGGGFLNSALIAYWFFRRYGTSESDLAVLFFTARVLNAVSHVAAAWIAQRVGLVNTMVLTHLPSSLLLMAAPAAPTAALAGALFLAREALVEMDVPTRQSYVMAVVQPHERTLASGVTNVTRNVGWAIGPSLAGLAMRHLSLAAPLFIGSVLKIGYDVMLYASFRRVKPPEEEQRG
jgi:MFS family permease